MSVESEILRIQHNIASAYTKVSEKGGEVPLQPTSANLAAAIGTIASGGSSGGVPLGTIVIWSGTAEDIPDGWALCDGQDGRPDLRDKFVLGAGTAHAVGATGGEETHTLTVEEMPSHIHLIYTVPSSATGYNAPIGGAGTKRDQGAKIESMGGSQPHNNMPPYYALCYIIKTSPDASSGGGAYSTEETRIGTWINGKPIYRKVFTFTTGSAQPIDEQIPWDDAGIVDRIVQASGCLRDSTGSIFPVGFCNPDNKLWVSVYRASSGKLFLHRSGARTTVAEAAIILEYTKTTD